MWQACSGRSLLALVTQELETADALDRSQAGDGEVGHRDRDATAQPGREILLEPARHARGQRAQEELVELALTHGIEGGEDGILVRTIISNY